MFAASVSSELNVTSVYVKISSIGRRKPAHFMVFQRVLTRYVWPLTALKNLVIVSIKTAASWVL